MSSSYNFSFKADIKTTLSSSELIALNFLCGDIVDTVSELPQHSFFDQGLPKHPFSFQYRNFHEMSYTCETWVTKKAKGDINRRRVNIFLPGQKLEGVYETCLPFASWLASISADNGFAGAFYREDAEDFNPTLLFVRRKELYFGNSTEAHSFLTGEKVSWNSS